MGLVGELQSTKFAHSHPSTQKHPGGNRSPGRAGSSPNTHNNTLKHLFSAQRDAYGDKKRNYDIIIL